MGCTSSSANQEPQQQQPPPAPAVVRRNSAGRQTAGGPAAPPAAARRNERRPAASFAAAVVGWDKEFPAITPSQLQSKRNEFWDTRVQGRAEVWRTLRVAVESGEEGTSDAILESAELTPFDIENPEVCFCYDSKGFKYDIPLYCMYTPANLLQEPSAAAIAAAKAQQQAPLQVQVAPTSARQQTPAGEGEEVKSAEAAGDASAPGGKTIKFKIRFSNGLADLSIDQKSSCTIGALKTLIATKYPDLAPERVRIYYLGKHMVSNQWNLGEIGMKKEMVLQCFIPAAKRVE